MAWGTVIGYTWNGAAYHVECLPHEALTRSAEKPNVLLSGQDDEAVYGIPDGMPMSCGACLQYIASDGDDYRKRAVNVTLTIERDGVDVREVWHLPLVAPLFGGYGIRAAAYIEARRRGTSLTDVIVESWENA